MKQENKQKKNQNNEILVFYDKCGHGRIVNIDDFDSDEKCQECEDKK